MINGRRRDHGADRAHLQLFDVGKNQVANCQVCELLRLTQRDCGHLHPALDSALLDLSYHFAIHVTSCNPQV
jgi:hypothetical protein